MENESSNQPQATRRKGEKEWVELAPGRVRFVHVGPGALRAWMAKYQGLLLEETRRIVRLRRDLVAEGGVKEDYPALWPKEDGSASVVTEEGIAAMVELARFMLTRTVVGLDMPGWDDARAEQEAQGDALATARVAELERMGLLEKAQAAMMRVQEVTRSTEFPPSDTGHQQPA